MSALKIDFNYGFADKYLSHILRNVSDTRPILADIGELLTETTKRRFSTSTAPDGSKWERNSQVTIDRYVGLFKTKKASRAASKKPLIGETKSLMTTIDYQFGPGFVRIGSPMVYSAMQQIGGTRAQHSHLWGDIPARPFLGLSKDDREGIIDIVHSYLG